MFFVDQFYFGGGYEVTKLNGFGVQLLSLVVS
jgi:hypothetical protein